MAIPGSKPKFDIHAKVRIGVKKTIQTRRGEREIPASVDYFVSDSPDFAELAGEQPKTLLIRLVHDTLEDAFSTGLEWWKGKVLACYTKGQGNPPVALRVADLKVKDGTLNFLDADDERLGPNRGQGRAPIVCRARECPHFKAGDECKPMGRLVFTLNADPLSRVWELDTKGWNSIEALEGTLRLAAARGSLLGRLFELSVAFQQRGGERFPVLSIKEIADQSPGTAAVIQKAEATIGREKVIAAREAGEERSRQLLAIYFDHAHPGWRDDEDFVERVQARIEAVGADEALEKVMGG